MTRFNIGQSGNPAGRPIGAIGVLTKKRAVLESHLPAIVEGIKKLSQTGDTETLTNCLQDALNIKPFKIEALK